MCVLSGMYYFTIFTIYKKDLIFKTKKVLKIIRYLLMRINFRVLFNIAFWLSKIYAKCLKNHKESPEKIPTIQ